MMSQTKQLIHAISTPITNILLNTQLALDYCQQKQDQSNLKHYLEQSLTASKYLQSFLLESRQQQNFQQQFSVLARIKAALKLSQFAEHHRQIIKYLNLNKQLQLKGNGYHFQEALICLLNNAFEAYPSKAVNRLVIFSARVIKNNLYLSITDGGNGMNWLQQKLAPIKRITYKNKHLGIGLSFAKKIFCKKMNGQIKILSKVNRGTTISVKLPLNKLSSG